MLQLSADFNLPTLPAGSILATGSKSKGGAFVDLLGLALEGQFGALTAGTKTTLEADATLLASEDTAGLPADVLAALGQDPARQDLAALLLAGLPAMPSNLSNGSVATPAPTSDTNKVSSEEGSASLVGISLTGERTKLPAAPAELAAPAARLARIDVKPETLAPASPGDASLELGLTGEETLPSELTETTQGQPHTVAPLLKQTSTQANIDQAGVGAAQALNVRQARETEMAGGANPVALRVMAPLGGAEWRAEIGDRIAWMVGRGAQSAELVLNPPALGTIEVKLNMNMAGNEAGAQFFSANANVRDALEASFPRLRELLASAGINLGDTTLSSQSFADQREQTQSGQGGSGASSGDTSGVVAAGERVYSSAGRLSGLVDLYI